MYVAKALMIAKVRYDIISQQMLVSRGSKIQGILVSRGFGSKHGCCAVFQIEFAIPVVVFAIGPRPA